LSTSSFSKIGIGLDFGTSNSAAAWFDGQRVMMIPLEEEITVMPTAVHLDRMLHAKTGARAIAQYIEENRDRVVELTPEIIAQSSLLTAEAAPDDLFAKPEVSTAAVYGAAVIDRGLPGRLFRGIKRLIGNEEIKRLMVFEHPFRLVALITPILKAIRLNIEQIVGIEPDQVVIGRPVEFEGHESANAIALERLSEAASYAGLRSRRFYPEPLAATLSYLVSDQARQSKIGQGISLTFDFGGGTLDLSLVRYQGTALEVLATRGLAKGGDYIDQMMFKQFISPQLGQGERWVRRVDGEWIDTEFPFDEFESLLLNWPVTYTLNQSKYRSKIRDGINQGGSAGSKFQRLEDLITHNHGYLVFQAIRDAKAALSESETSVIDIPELDLEIPLDRVAFESLLAELRGEIGRLIDDILTVAGISADEVSLVIRTGGSSLIASIKAHLEARFPGKVIAHDPFTSVAAGLAIASYYGADGEGVVRLNR